MRFLVALLFLFFAPVAQADIITGGGNAPAIDADVLFNCDFTKGTNPSATGTCPTLTYARNDTVATYYNSSGVLTVASANAMRFNYDPKTLKPKGILLEVSKTNYVKYSTPTISQWETQNADQAYNTADLTDPFGTNTAAKFTESTTKVPHRVLPVATSTGAVVSGQTYTISMICASGTAHSVQMANYDSFPDAHLNVQCDSGEYWLGSTFSAYGYAPSTGEWKEFWATETANGSGQPRPMNVYFTSDWLYSTRALSYLGIGQYFYIAHMQLEDGGKSSPIVTGGTAATRQADVLFFTVPASVTQVFYKFANDTYQYVNVTAGTTHTVDTATLNYPDVKLIGGI